MIIHWQDRDWQVEFDDLTMKQAEVIEAETGMTIGAWLDTLSSEEGFDPESTSFLKTLKVIYWLMLDQNGDKTPIGAVDFSLLKFGTAFVEAMAAEAAQAPVAPAEVVPVPPVTASETRYPGPPTLPDGTNSASTPAPVPSALA